MTFLAATEHVDSGKFDAFDFTPQGVVIGLLLLVLWFARKELAALWARITAAHSAADVAHAKAEAVEKDLNKHKLEDERSHGDVHARVSSLETLSGKHPKIPRQP